MNFPTHHKQYSFISDISIIFIISTLLFVIAQFDREFVQFESRFGLFAQEMWRNGITFFPTTYNQFYPDYPATQTILTYFFSLLLGKVTSLTAILPTALASAITLVFTYLIGAMKNRYWGWYGVLILLSTFAFVEAARSIALDQFTTTATVISFYLVYSAQELGMRKRLWFLPLIWFFSFIMRGPIGLIIPACITGSYYLLEKKWSATLKTGFGGLVLLTVCVTGLLLAARYTGGTDFLHHVIRAEALGRITGLTVNSDGSYLWIALENYAICFPLALIIFLSHIKQIFQFRPIDEDYRLLRHLYLWILIVMVGLSIPMVTKARYILPVAPAAALAGAYLFVSDQQPAIILFLRKQLIHLCSFFPVLGLLALFGSYIYARINQLSLDINYFIVGSTLIVLTIIAITTWKKCIDKQQQQFIIIACSVATFICLYIGAIQPLDVQFNSVKSFVAVVENNWKPNQALVFYKIGPDQEDIKFMAALNKPVIPQFLHKHEQLLNYTSPAILIARDENFVQLTRAQQQLFTILAQQRLGHNLCDVLIRNNAEN